jgi:hypothetical protein
MVQQSHSISGVLRPQSAENTVVLMDGFPQKVVALPVILFPSNKRTSVVKKNSTSSKIE